MHAEAKADTSVRQVDADWGSSIMEVDLKRQGLRRLQGLEQLTNLRKACFAENELSLIQGLSACIALQDLSFQVQSVSCVHSPSCHVDNRRHAAPEGDFVLLRVTQNGPDVRRCQNLAQMPT